MDTFVIYRPFAFSSAQSQRDGYYSAKPIPEVWSDSMAFGFKVVHPLSRPMKHGTSRELHVGRGRTSSWMSRPSFLLFSAWRQSQTEALAKLLTQTIPLTSKANDIDHQEAHRPAAITASLDDRDIDSMHTDV